MTDSWLINSMHVRSVPVHPGKARPQIADGEDSLQTWRVTTNILLEQ